MLASTLSFLMHCMLVSSTLLLVFVSTQSPSCSFLFPFPTALAFAGFWHCCPQPLCWSPSPMATTASAGYCESHWRTTSGCFTHTWNNTSWQFVSHILAPTPSLLLLKMDHLSYRELTSERLASLSCPFLPESDPDSDSSSIPAKATFLQRGVSTDARTQSLQVATLPMVINHPRD